MKLIEFCVRYPVTVLVGVILVILFGGISVFRLPLQMIPTVDRPEITVETEYPGAAPLEVEQEVVKRQEEKLNAVENLREITSSSIEGKGTIVLRFDWGVNKDIARLAVSEKLDLVTDLPRDAKEPVIRAINSDEETPIAWLGRSLNIITLAGIGFASGMVVDNAVVVLENIYRHQEMGKGRMRAALDGAAEVWGAVLGATLTTVAVFVPVLFVQQEAGQLFRDIAIAISAAVTFSLVVSVTVVPMFSARVLAVRPRGPGAWWRGLRVIGAGLDRLGAGFVAAVVGFLTWLRRGLVRQLAAAGLIVVGSIAASYAFAPPIDYLPQGNRNFVFAVVRTPPGFNTDQKEAILRELEGRFMGMRELDRLFGVVRIEAPIMGAIVKPEYADLPGMRRVLAEMRGRTIGVPGPEAVFITQSPLFRSSSGFFGGSNVDINVKGADLETVRETAQRLEGALRGLEGVNFVFSSFEWGSPELQVVIDRERAAALGLSVAQPGW